jgi:hypothetical protein
MLRVRLGYKHTTSPRVFAYVDSGSPYCLFKIGLADLIGLDPKKDPVFTDELKGVVEGATDTVYFHKVKLLFDAGHQIQVVAGFAKGLSTQAILGRNGFFDHFKVTFDHSVDPPAFDLEKIQQPI